MLYALFVKHHLLPSVVMGLSPGERAFLYASVRVAAEEEAEAYRRAKG